MRPVLGKQLLQTISFYFQFEELRVLQHDCYMYYIVVGRGQSENGCERELTEMKHHLNLHIRRPVLAEL